MNAQIKELADELTFANVDFFYQIENFSGKEKFYEIRTIFPLDLDEKKETFAAAATTTKEENSLKKYTYLLKENDFQKIQKLYKGIEYKDFYENYYKKTYLTKDKVKAGKIYKTIKETEFFYVETFIPEYPDFPEFEKKQEIYCNIYFYDKEKTLLRFAVIKNKFFNKCFNDDAKFRPCTIGEFEIALKKIEEREKFRQQQIINNK